MIDIPENLKTICVKSEYVLGKCTDSSNICEIDTKLGIGG